MRYRGSSEAAYSETDNLVFRTAVSMAVRLGVIPGDVNVTDISLWGGSRRRLDEPRTSAQRRANGGSPPLVDLEIFFGVDVISNLPVADVQNKVNGNLALAFNTTVASTVGGPNATSNATSTVMTTFDYLIKSIAESLSVSSSATVLVTPTKALLQQKSTNLRIVSVVTTSPSLAPTPPPSPLPIPIPSSLPSLQPTVSLFAALRPEETAATVAVAVGAVVMASVSTSISASIGASVATATTASTATAVVSTTAVTTTSATGASVAASTTTSAAGASASAATAGSTASGGSSSATGGTGSGGSSNIGGDPLSLVFLVQGVALTRRIGGMPQTYVEFASGFNMFNLQVPPPAWLSDATQRRRLQSSLFSDATLPTEMLRGHLFYSVLVGLFVLALHYFVVQAVTRSGKLPVDKIPNGFKVPHFEVKVATALAIGTFDSALGVLTTSETSVGWKCVASLEVVALFAFVGWFMLRGFEFRDTSQWVPIANVPTMRKSRHHELKESLRYSFSEVMWAAGKCGMTAEEALDVFKKYGADTSGVLDEKAWEETFGAENLTLLVPLAECTWYEFIFIMLKAPVAEAGKYFPLDASKGDVNEPWGRHFNGT